MTRRSERRLNNPMVILLKVSTCLMPKEAEPSLLNKMGDCTTAGGLPDGSVGNMSGIWNPKDFAQRPWVEGVKSPSKSFRDWLGFGSIHQHRKNIDFIQPDLRINTDTWLHLNRTHCCRRGWYRLTICWFRWPLSLGWARFVELGLCLQCAKFWFYPPVRL